LTPLINQTGVAGLHLNPKDQPTPKPVVGFVLGGLPDYGATLLGVYTNKSVP